MTDASVTRCPLAPGPGEDLALRQIRTEPLAFVTELAAEYGDTVRYGAPGWAATLTNTVDGVRRVLLDRFTAYEKEGTPDLRMLRPMLGEGLLTSDGEAWTRQRALLNPLFKRHKVAQLDGVMTTIILEMVEDWVARGGEEPIDIGDEMAALTLRIAARALFGFEVADEAEGFGRAMDTLNETVGHLDSADPGTRAAYLEALSLVRSIVQRIVLHRLIAPADGTDDVLATLIDAARKDNGPPRPDDPALIDQVLTLLLAGHETTAKALTWTLHLVSQHPAVAARLREEADAMALDRTPTAADLPSLPFAWAVIQEAMRLYPPIWLVSRRARVDDRVDGCHVGAGELVTFSPYLLHRRSSLWPDPDAFRPERFMGARAAGDVEDTAGVGDNFAFLPFGGGPRQCIGRQFATLEMRLALPMIVAKVDLAPLTDRAVEIEALVTLRPKERLLLVARPRRQR